MSSALKESGIGETKTSPGFDHDDVAPVPAEASLPRLTAGKAKGKTDYLVFTVYDRVERVGVHATWNLLCIVSCSNHPQAIRAAANKYGAGKYAAVGTSKWHEETMEEQTEIKLRFV